MTIRMTKKMKPSICICTGFFSGGEGDRDPAPAAHPPSCCIQWKSVYTVNEKTSDVKFSCINVNNGILFYGIGIPAFHTDMNGIL